MTRVTSNVLVREAIFLDKDALVQQILAQAKESEGLELELDILEKGVTAVFENSNLGTYWVIEDKDSEQIVGGCLVTVEWSDWRNTQYWWVQSVYIAPEFRGRGLLKELLSQIEIKAQKACCQELRLYVDKANKRAIAAYEKIGWTDSHYLMMDYPVS